MTPARFERRLRYWQKKMLLADWKITVTFGQVDCKADCEATPEYREATIRFNADKILDNEVDAYCVHELAHAVNWQIETIAENSVDDNDTRGHETVRFIAETTATKWEEIILHIAGKK